MKKALLPLAVLVPFSAYSVWVILQKGYFGFLELALREPWGAQVLIDLAISVFLFATWMKRDAQARGIPAWPYLVTLPFLGSVVSLVYLIHRAFSDAPESRSVESASAARGER